MEGGAQNKWLTFIDLYVRPKRFPQPYHACLLPRQRRPHENGKREGTYHEGEEQMKERKGEGVTEEFFF